MNLIRGDRMTRYPHMIPFSVSGKTGEVKTISRTPSDDGTLRLFKAQGIRGSDTAKVPNTGTLISAKCGDHWPISGARGRFSTRYCSGLHENCYGTVCHPRLPIFLTVEFLEDCTWSGYIAGEATTVSDEGIYAIVPSVPCQREIPAEYRDVQRNDDGWDEGFFLQHHKAHKCEHCWFEYVMHPTWPWRDREYLIEAIVPPGMQEFVISPENRFLARKLHVVGYDERAFFSEKTEYHATKFRLRAFGRPGEEQPLRYSKDEKGPWAGFGVGCLPWVLLNVGERLRVQVENVSLGPLAFQAAVQGDEWIGGR